MYMYMYVCVCVHVCIFAINQYRFIKKGRRGRRLSGAVLTSEVLGIGLVHLKERK